jgi:subtilisin family serine protease
MLIACLLVLILSFGETTYTDIQYSRYPWYFESLKVRSLREREPKQQVTVAIADSGLSENALPYFEYQPAFYDAVNDEYASFSDPTGHGTEIAMLIASNSKKKCSEYGISPKVHLLIVKVEDEHGVTTTDYLHSGLSFLLTQDIDIINISLGTKKSNEIIEDDLRKLYEKGCFIHCAAGDDSGSFAFPASSEYTFAIQTQDIDSQMDSFSNSSDSKPGILCPGQDIPVIVWNRAGEKILVERTGSSFACAIFSGYLSLLLESRVVENDSFSPATLVDRIDKQSLYDEAGFLSLI